MDYKKKNRIMYVLLILAVILFSFVFFSGQRDDDSDENYSPDEYQEKRLKMIEEQLKPRGIIDEKVIKAMENVPRHMFMPHSRDLAYEDHPVPIGYGQTISQPYIVALMIQELMLKEDDIVLEIGAGSGYNAAVIAEIVKEVYTIEIIKELAEWAESALDNTGYKNVHVKHGDGYFGWPGKEFDAVIITAAANHIPQPLLDQLKIGGKLILPLSSPAGFQTLTMVKKTDSGFETKVITGVRFVPMTGRAQE